MQKNSGFSLLELLIVIGIIAVLTAAGVPGFLSYLPNYRLNSAVSELHSTLMMSKLKAVKEGYDVVVEVSTGTGDGATYNAYVDNGAGGTIANNGSQDGAEPTFRRGSMPKGITIDDVSFQNDRAIFNSRGLPKGPVGAIQLSNSKGVTQTVSVTIAGGVRMQ